MIILVFLLFFFVFFFSPLPPLYSHYCLWTFHSVDRGCVFTYHLFSSSLYGKLTRVFSLILYYWEQCMWLFFLSFFPFAFFSKTKGSFSVKALDTDWECKKNPNAKPRLMKPFRYHPQTHLLPHTHTPPTSFQARSATTSHSFIFFSVAFLFQLCVLVSNYRGLLGWALDTRLWLLLLLEETCCFVRRRIERLSISHYCHMRSLFTHPSWSPLHLSQSPALHPNPTKKKEKQRKKKFNSM